MKAEKRDRRYKTHPLVKAGLIMAAMVTAAVCAASYGFYRYVMNEASETAVSRERCAYEAYVSLCEDIARGEAGAAADALSRCELFAGCGEMASLREAILSELVNERIADALSIDGAATPEAIRRAVKSADKAAAETVGGGARVLGESTDGGSFWATLEGRVMISEDKARDVAAEMIGGGASLSAAKNHTFPLVYTFVCKNASADITRMGGRLLRFYSFRRGGADVRTEDECREAARAFVKKAEIADAVLDSAREDRDGYEYTFRGTLDVDGETVEAIGEDITVRVARAGARVYFFDAFEYYKHKPVFYGELKVKLGRAEAARQLGVNERFLTLIYADGRLFWRLSGVKTLLFDVLTGEIRPQNP